MKRHISIASIIVIAIIFVMTIIGNKYVFNNPEAPTYEEWTVIRGILLFTGFALAIVALFCELARVSRGSGGSE